MINDFMQAGDEILKATARAIISMSWMKYCVHFGTDWASVELGLLTEKEDIM